MSVSGLLFCVWGLSWGKWLLTGWNRIHLWQRETVSVVYDFNRSLKGDLCHLFWDFFTLLCTRAKRENCRCSVSEDFRESQYITRNLMHISSSAVVLAAHSFSRYWKRNLLLMSFLARPYKSYDLYYVREFSTFLFSHSALAHAHTHPLDLWQSQCKLPVSVEQISFLTNLNCHGYSSEGSRARLKSY